jgi:hypothetical protein
MKSTGIFRKAVYSNDGKIGVVKDLIIENGPRGQESLSQKGYTSPDWWISHLEIELDETFKKELIAAKKLAPTGQTATFALKLTGFGKGSVNLTDKGVEIKVTKAQAGDNIGTLDALFKPTTITKPKLP